MTCPCDTCKSSGDCEVTGYECMKYYKYINASIPVDVCSITKVKCEDYDKLLEYCCVFKKSSIDIEEGNCPIPRIKRGRPTKPRSG